MIFLRPQAWSLNFLPGVFLLYMGRAAALKPELLRFAGGTATLGNELCPLSRINV
jgi:hypothetical protein